jgi:hypothetical protein
MAALHCGQGMTLAEIKSRIADAAEHECATGELRHKLADELPALKRVLVLEGPEPLDSVMAFITRYIESVPGSIGLVTAVSKRLGFYDYAAPFLAMAEDYFLHPPEDIARSVGLEPLLDEAFLAHRLLEEVNDQHIRHLQRPLLPIDMTEANIIVHHLLGDPLATRLEQLVSFTSSRIFHKAYVWTRVRELPGAVPTPDLVISSETLTRSPGSIRLRLSG